MPANRVVAHEKEGRVLKGMTLDFLPKRPVFHLTIAGVEGDRTSEIAVEALKALFFVKDFEGNKDYHELKGFSDQPVSGKKVRVTFSDGEEIYGYTHVINYDQPGFVLVPSDPGCNNERIFVVFSSITDLEVDGRQVYVGKYRRRR